MSLLRQRHLSLAAALVLAIWAPLRLSDPDIVPGAIVAAEPVRAVRVNPPPAPQASVTRGAFLDPAGFALVGGDALLAGAVGQAAPGGAPGAAPLPPLPPAPVLVGTATGPSGKAIALVKSASGSPHSLKRGQAVDGWTLTGIGRGEARFAQRGEVHVARLTAPAPAADAPTPSRSLANSQQDMQP